MNGQPGRIQTRILGVCVLLTIAAATRADTVTQPKQPSSGPGSTWLAHTSVIRERYGVGNAQFWIYEPGNPKPATAPVIVFLHGWSATNPAAYGAWIDHLVGRGNIVIYPRYQADIRTLPAKFLPNTLLAVQSALSLLKAEPGHVRPELDHVAVVGHSAGGNLAADLGAIAAQAGIPLMRAVMCVAPGGTTGIPMFRINLVDLSTVPSTTLMLAVVGDDDHIAGTTDAMRIFQETTAIPASNKNYVILHSDRHGQPPIVANHFAPAAVDSDYDDPGTSDQSGGEQPIDGDSATSRRPDAAAYYGYWKLFDALCDAAFYGFNRDYALGNTPKQRFMGVWSDGTPVTELEIVTNP